MENDYLIHCSDAERERKIQPTDVTYMYVVETNQEWFRHIQGHDI